MALDLTHIRHIAVSHIFEKSRYTQSFSRRWVTLWQRFWLHYPIESKIIRGLFAHFSILQCKQKPELFIIYELPTSINVSFIPFFIFGFWSLLVTNVKCISLIHFSLFGQSDQKQKKSAVLLVYFLY